MEHDGENVQIIHGNIIVMVENPSNTNLGTVDIVQGAWLAFSRKSGLILFVCDSQLRPLRPTTTHSTKQPAKDEVAATIERAEKHGNILHLSAHQFLAPGFVDCHIHAPQFAFTGTATDTELMAWLDKYTFPSETSLRGHFLEDGTAVDNANPTPTHGQLVMDECVRCTLSNGTTTAVYFATLHTGPSLGLARAMLRLGQRGFVGKISMDRNSPDNYSETTDEAADLATKFVTTVRQLQSINSNASSLPLSSSQAPLLVQPIITPRFLPTCSEPLMAALGALANSHDVHVQTHASESLGVVELNSQLSTDNARDIDIYDRSSLLGPKTVLAHVVHANDSELRLLAARGTAVAHCPLSNYFFADGAFAVVHATNLGVRVGLGTDVAGGYSPSMLSAIRSAVTASRTIEWNARLSGKGESAQSRCIDFRNAFWLATMGGARAMRMEQWIGSLEQGKCFDAIVLDALCDAQSAVGGVGGVRVFSAVDSVSDVFQKVVNLGDDRHVSRVWVMGRQVK